MTDPDDDWPTDRPALDLPPVPLRYPRPALISAAALLAAGVVAVVVCGLAVAGWAAASVAVGVVIALVILFASVSMLYLADRLDNRLALPTAVGLFVFCVLVVVLIGFRLSDHGLVRRAPVGLAVLGGALVWTVAYAGATVTGLHRLREADRSAN